MKHIIDTEQIEKLKAKSNVYTTDLGAYNAGIDAVLALIANSPQADGMVLDEFVQGLKGRARFCRDRGEIKTPELLEKAAQLLSAYKPQAEKAIDPSVERALCESDATIYGRGYMLNGERIPPQDLLIFDNQNTRTKQADDVDAERMAMLFAPDKKCDMGCMYACTKGFTERAECIDRNKYIRELTDALKDLADSISANDDEGLCEHAEPMIKARALIDKARE